MRRIAFAAVLAAVIDGAGWLAFQRLTAIPPPGTLYGNVEIRQVDLPDRRLSQAHAPEFPAYDSCVIALMAYSWQPKQMS